MEQNPVKRSKSIGLTRKIQEETRPTGFLIYAVRKKNVI